VERIIRLLALSSFLALAALLAIEPSGAGSRRGQAPAPAAPIVKTWKIAPGLTYTKIVQRQVPRRTFVLRLDLRKAITLDTTIADAALPSRRPLSDIVRSHGALAGVNGDYGDGGPGRPVHHFAQDGELLQSTGGLSFAVTRDESAVLFGLQRLEVTLTDQTNGRVYRVDRWNNGGPAPGGLRPAGRTAETGAPRRARARSPNGVGAGIIRGAGAAPRTAP